MCLASSVSAETSGEVVVAWAVDLARGCGWGGRGLGFHSPRGTYIAVGYGPPQAQHVGPVLRQVSVFCAWLASIRH
eukprot:scaffold169240_cov19-Prasinocladus_malaysianus.AAC.3